MKNRIKRFWNDHREALVVGVGITCVAGGVVAMMAENITQQNIIDTAKVVVDDEGVVLFDVTKKNGWTVAFKVDDITDAAKKAKKALDEETKAFNKLVDAAKDMDDAVANKKAAKVS